MASSKAPIPIRNGLDADGLAKTAPKMRLGRKTKAAAKAESAANVEPEAKDAVSVVAEPEQSGVKSPPRTEADSASAVTQDPPVVHASPLVDAPPAAPSHQPAVRSEPKKPRRWLKRLLWLLVSAAVIAGIAVGAWYAWPEINDRYLRTLDTNTKDLSSVQDRLAVVEKSDAEIVDRLDGIDARIATQTGRIKELNSLADSLGTDLADINSTAARTLETTRAAELMSRARLFLYQANYGLASADLESARALLADAPKGGDAVDAQFAEVIDRLDRAIGNLPDLPVAAAGDLDIAWQVLLSPVKETGADAKSTPTDPAADPAARPATDPAASTETTVASPADAVEPDPTTDTTPTSAPG